MLFWHDSTPAPEDLDERPTCGVAIDGGEAFCTSDADTETACGKLACDEHAGGLHCRRCKLESLREDYENDVDCGERPALRDWE
jgi:hypothetical protein